MFAARFLALGSVCFWVAACAGPGGGNSVPIGDAVIGEGFTNDTLVPVPASFTQFKTQLLNKTCELLLQCGTGSDLGAFSQLFDSASQCVQLFGASSELSLADVEAQIGAGTVVFDAQAANACLAGLSAQSLCSGVGDFRVLCQAAFVGSASQGDACTVSEECAEGLFCQGDGCLGVCVATKAEGEQCSEALECSSPVGGGYAECAFDPVDFNLVCTELSIASAYAGPGAPCGRIDDGGTLTQVLCSDGLYCEAGQGDEGVCVTFVGAGQACSQEQRCTPGSECIPNGQGGATCQAYTIQSAPGLSCAPQDLAVCDPTARLYCDGDTQTCKQLGDGSVGAVCSTSGYVFNLPGTNCDLGNYCDEETQRCAPLKVDGDVCSDGDECASEVCNGESCVPRCQ